MSSSRKQILHVPAAGIFKQSKKNPNHRSLWIVLCFVTGKRKGKFAGVHEIHRLPLKHLQEAIVHISKWLEGYQGYPEPIASAELALDYLFAELGRRAARKVLS